MQYVVSKLYKYHSKNLRFLNTALEKNSNSARNAIATQDKDAIKTFVRMQHFLLGAWAEVRLCKLLNENKSFNQDELRRITSCSSQLEQWNKVVELAFRRRYNVKRAPLSVTSLAPTDFHRYQVISGVINKELKDIIELRNRIAHGQWEFLLNSEATNIEQDKMEKIKRENLQSLIFKKNLIGYLADLIHDLVVSPITFERDFDLHYKGVLTFQSYVKTRLYSKYEDQLKNNHVNGKRKKKEQLATLKMQMKSDIESELRDKIRMEIEEELSSKTGSIVVNVFSKLKKAFN